MFRSEDNKRCFGEYRCKKCHKTWMSAFCWNGEYQKCKTCDTPVYAHKMTPLEKPEGLDKSDVNKPHLTHLCGKCKKLGFNCQDKSFY